MTSNSPLVISVGREGEDLEADTLKLKQGSRLLVVGVGGWVGGMPATTWTVCNSYLIVDSWSDMIWDFVISSENVCLLFQR